jgi:ABC-type glycerol-3-phosphate transport system substrate-binding protein
MEEIGMAMNKSRREFLKAAGLTTAALSLAACAPQAQPTASAGEPTQAAPAAANVTLEFWTFNDYAMGKPLEIFNSFISKFQDSNKGIKINITGKPGSDILANVLAGASSGELPDALQIQLGSGGDLIAINALVDMNPYWTTMPADYQNQFNKGAMDPCKQEGKVYGLPFSAYACILYRNLKVLKKAGIDPSAGVKDWDDFASQLEKVSALGMKGTGKILGNDWCQLHFYGGVPGTSKRRIAPDGKATELTADAYATLWDYAVKIKPYCAGSFMFDTATADLFKTDQLGFVTMGPWLAPDLEAAKAKSGLDFDAVEIPGQTADQKGTIRGGEFTGITSPKQADATWKFVSFISDYPQEASWAAQIGRLMANDKALEQPDAKANWLVQLTGKAFNSAVDETLFMKKVATGFGQPEVDFGNQVDTGVATPKDAAPKMIDAINKILAAG